MHSPVFVPFLEWTKPEKTPASLTVNVKQETENFKATFEAIGEKMKAKAKGLWKLLPHSAKKGSFLNSLSFVSFSVESLKLGRHKLKGTLSQRPPSQSKHSQMDSNLHLDIQGNFIDLSTYAATAFDKPHSQAPLSSFELTFKVDEVKLSPRFSLHAMKGMLLASQNRLMLCDVQGFSQEKSKPFSLQMAPKGKGSEGESFFLETEDAGAFLELIYPSGRLKGGSLKMKGEKNSISKEIKGEITLHDFTVMEAPLLTRILSATSPDGMLRLLTGKGLLFNNGTINFLLTPNKMSLKNLRFSSLMIALLLEGHLDYQTENCSFRGEVFPFYAANTFLAHIPILGHALAGKDQEGILAVSFSLIGPKDNLEVKLNPLSPFAPRSLSKALQSPAK